MISDEQKSLIGKLAGRETFEAMRKHWNKEEPFEDHGTGRGARTSKQAQG
jgi:hypothetical protein